MMRRDAVEVWKASIYGEGYCTLREARTDLAKIDGDDYFEMHYSVGKDGSAVETLG
jgi:hypothetical protein